MLGWWLKQPHRPLPLRQCAGNSAIGGSSVSKERFKYRLPSMSSRRGPIPPSPLNLVSRGGLRCMTALWMLWRLKWRRSQTPSHPSTSSSATSIRKRNCTGCGSTNCCSVLHLRCLECFIDLLHHAQICCRISAQPRSRNFRRKACPPRQC